MMDIFARLVFQHCVKSSTSCPHLAVERRRRENISNSYGQFADSAEKLVTKWSVVCLVGDAAVSWPSEASFSRFATQVGSCAVRNFVEPIAIDRRSLRISSEGGYFSIDG